MVTRSIRESAVESYLVKQVELRGGVAEKVTVIGRRGFFDRLIVLPRLPFGARVVFVEVKKPRGGRVSAHQRKRHVSYRSLGAEIAVVKSTADVDRLVGEGVQIPGGSSDTG